MTGNIRIHMTAVLIAALTGIAASAQDIISFPGIRTGCGREETVLHLMSQGFTPKEHGRTFYLEGKIDGRKMNVYVVTAEDRVSRIVASEARTTSAARARKRFNDLVRTFDGSDEYSAATGAVQTIPENEAIERLMAEKGVIYQAAFSKAANGAGNAETAWFTLNEYKGGYYIMIYFENR